MLTVTVNELPSWIKLAAKSKNNILVVGDPGVGKSQVIGSLENENCKVTMMTGSSTIEEYVNGIPTPDSMKFGDQDIRVLKYVAPQWFADMMAWQSEHPDGKQILFLDEFNTADPQVLKTFLTILTERKIPTLGMSLPDSCVIVAAMNPQDQNEGEPLIRPMASRFMTLKIAAGMDVYRGFLKGNTPTVSGVLPKALDQPAELDVDTKLGFIDQISDSVWQKFDEKNGHEINPRSMSNFIRALEWCENPKMFVSNLAQAFLGITLRWPTPTASKGNKGFKPDSTYLTREQLDKLSDIELKQYMHNIEKPNIKGPDALRSRSACRLVCKSRGISFNG